jgi:hypothetical protein
VVSEKDVPFPESCFSPQPPAAAGEQLQRLKQLFPGITSNKTFFYLDNNISGMLIEQLFIKSYHNDQGKKIRHQLSTILLSISVLAGKNFGSTAS